MYCYNVENSSSLDDLNSLGEWSLGRWAGAPKVPIEMSVPPRFREGEPIRFFV